MADQGAKVAATHAVKRSHQWRNKRSAHLKKNPYCAACKPPSRWRRLLHAGKTLIGLKPVQVHHIFPFHTCVVLGRPDLELDDRNLITLCESGENHHLLIGHLGDFASYNPEVIKQAQHTFHGKTLAQIKADQHWQKLHEANPRDVDKLDELEKAALKDLIDGTFPMVKP